MKNLTEDNDKLVREFGAKLVSNIRGLPDFYGFSKGLIYSHRDFNKFLLALNRGEKCAIVSGFNASGTIHLGHKALFDTNLFFQRKYGVSVYIPISDDESYVTGKVKTQEEAKKNSIKLAKELVAYGFNPLKTIIIIDSIYTNIYNLAFKLSRKVNYSEIKAAYGYLPEENIGLHFYPAVQAAHILFPNEHAGISNILVPIGADEDSHIRISRDIASRAGYKKPASIHVRYVPGIDGKKASTTKENTIFFNDNLETIKKKIKKAFSGGQKTIEEHKKYGGNPDVDIACQYLSYYFYDEKKSNKLFEEYRKGKITSSEVKKLLFKEVSNLIKNFQERLRRVSVKDLEKSIIKNPL